MNVEMTVTYGQGFLPNKVEHSDFEDFLKESNLLPETVRFISENDADLIMLDNPYVEVKKSLIEGKGLFLTQPVKAGDVICPARIDNHRTQAGRFTNHSSNPNAKMVLLKNGDMDLVALVDINNGEITINYRQALALSDLKFKDGKLAFPMREKIKALEAEIEQLPQVDCPIRNIFAPGIYAREMTIFKDTILTGAVHKTCHLSILSKGHVRVVADEGIVEMVAPCTLISQPGAKRAIHALEDSVWTTIHATNETNVDKLVELLTESTADELIGGNSNRQLKFVNNKQLEE